MSYTVELENGRQHVDHLRAHIANAQPSVEMDDYPAMKTPSQNPDLPPADPSPGTVRQSLHHFSRPHKLPDRYGMSIRHTNGRDVVTE